MGSLGLESVLTEWFIFCWHRRLFFRHCLTLTVQFLDGLHSPCLLARLILTLLNSPALYLGQLSESDDMIFPTISSADLEYKQAIDVEQHPEHGYYIPSGLLISRDATSSHKNYGF